MNALVKAAVDHWAFVAPLLSTPKDEAAYDTLVAALDELQEITGYDEGHPLDGLVQCMANLISDFDKKHFPIPEATGVEVLRSIMEEHGVSQRDLPEIGSQSTVSQLLSGKRKLNVRQIRALADRFGVNPNVFLG